MSDARPTIVWFRRDLRLDDNPALSAAAGLGGPVVPLFVWSPDEERPWAPGAASRVWLHDSLAALAADLTARGSRLVLRLGPALMQLREVIRETGAGAVVWNRCLEPAIVARDVAVQLALIDDGVRAQTYSAGLLFEPREMAGREARPLQVFTPFWKRCLATGDPPEPRPAPPRWPSLLRWPRSDRLDEFRLRPGHCWADPIRAAWRPGEQGARDRLDRFLVRPVRAYPDDRNRPDLDGTSRLSPHLHFGEISPRRIWHEVADAASADAAARTAADVFLRELGWREFAHHVLFHFPHSPERPLRPEFERMPWREVDDARRAWEQGMTGYPLVDAGMRQLWSTGWMHNRVRMVVASFLVKHLMLPWQAGARWFWDTLVDADLANNTLGWQWSAGCGADAAPYFRVFNPVLQGRRFDPDGAYVRRWVPELARLPDDDIHAPWDAPPLVLQEAGVTLGRSYPRPLIDHAVARARALAAFHQLRGLPE